MDGAAREVRRASRPLKWVCGLLVKNQDSAFGIFLFLQTFLLVITGVLWWLDLSPFPADFTDVPLVLSDHPSYKRSMAWNLRNTQPGEPILQPEMTMESMMDRNIPADVTELMYKTTDGSDILTVEKLRAILHFENSLLKEKDYKKFCVIMHDSCIPTRSLPRLLEDFLGMPTNNTTSSKNLTELESTLKKVLYSYYKDQKYQMRGHLEDFLSKSYRVTDKIVTSPGLRSYYFIAWVNLTAATSNGYTTRDYAKHVLHPKLYGPARAGHLKEHGTIEFTYFNRFLYFDYLQIQVIRDLLLAVGSFCVIFCILWLQTKSLFISIFGVYGILTNFFGANLIYRYIFDYRYFGVFHVLAIFIILGIGVDDIFLFNDAWKATRRQGISNLYDRLIVSYHKASRSMFVTSLTTAVAFFVNALSPLLAIRSFGIFAGTLVVVNYISVITYFAAVLLENESRVHCFRKVVPTVETVEDRATLENTVNEGRDGLESRKSRIERAYLRLLGTPVFQVGTIFTGLLILAVMAYSSTLITIDDKKVKLYKMSHFLGRAFHDKETLFKPSFYEEPERGVEVYLVWGIRDLDRSMCHHTDWKQCVGKVVWDDNLDLNPTYAQKDLLAFCKYLKRLPENEIKKLRIITKELVPEVTCFAEDLDDYIEEQMDKVHSETSQQRTRRGFPATSVETRALLRDAPSFRDSILIANPYFYRNFETVMLYWLYSGLKNHHTAEAVKSLQYFRRIGHSLNSPDLISIPKNNVTTTYGTRLRYFAITVNTSINTELMSHQEGLEVFQEWERFFNEAKSNMQPSLRGGFVATPNALGGTSIGDWHWLEVKQTLMWSAIYGIAMSLCLAGPLLVFSTNNVVVGFIATLMIASTTVCVVGVIPLAGWKLGVLESLNLTLVVGLAVDYIVHIAEGYHMSLASRREDKVASVIRDVAISVLSGAASTLCASVFMLFAEIVFFMQFGIFIFCTVAFSILHALVIFLILLRLAGPQDDDFALSKLPTSVVIAYRKLTNDYELPRHRRHVDECDFSVETLETIAGNSLATPPASSLDNKKISSSIDDDNASSSGYDSADVKPGQTYAKLVPWSDVSFSDLSEPESPTNKSVPSYPRGIRLPPIQRAVAEGSALDTIKEEPPTRAPSVASRRSSGRSAKVSRKTKTPTPAVKPIYGSQENEL